MLGSTMKQMNISTNISIIVLLLALLTSVGRMKPRPLIVSLLGLVLIWYLFMSFRHSPDFHKILYVIPFITLVWSNLHPGVLMGLATLIALAFTEHLYSFVHSRSTTRTKFTIPPLPSCTLRRLWLVIGLSTVTASIHPYGFDVLVYFFQEADTQVLSLIQEWQPPFSGNVPDSALLWGYRVMLVIGLLGILYTVRKKDPYPALLYVMFSVSSLRAVRFVADFAVMTATGTAAGLQLLVDRLPQFFRTLVQGTGTTVTLIILMLITAISIPGENFHRDVLRYYGRFGFGIDERIFSSAMIQFLKVNEIRGTMFNQMEVGGLLIWERPGEKNFHDSRLLSKRATADYDTILHMRNGFEKKLSEYAIDYIVFHPRDLMRSPEVMHRTLISYCSLNREYWKLVYWDDRSMVYVANIPKFQRVIEKNEYKVLHPYIVAMRKDILDVLYFTEREAFVREVRRKQIEEPGGFFSRMCVEASRYYGKMDSKTK